MPAGSARMPGGARDSVCGDAQEFLGSRRCTRSWQAQATPYRVVHTQVIQWPPPALDMAALSAAVRVAPRPPQYLFVRGL